jgi:hypothetical protein
MQRLRAPSRTNTRASASLPHKHVCVHVHSHIHAHARGYDIFRCPSRLTTCKVQRCASHSAHARIHVIMHTHQCAHLDVTSHGRSGIKTKCTYMCAKHLHRRGASASASLCLAASSFPLVDKLSRIMYTHIGGIHTWTPCSGSAERRFEHPEEL